METCCYELQPSSESQYPEHGLVHFATNREKTPTSKSFKLWEPIKQEEKNRSKASDFGGANKASNFLKQCILTWWEGFQFRVQAKRHEQLPDTANLKGGFSIQDKPEDDVRSYIGKRQTKKKGV